jgi:hypothetical protein
MPLHYYPKAEEQAMEDLPGHPGMTWSKIFNTAQSNPKAPIMAYFYDMVEGHGKQPEGPYEYSETFYVISGTLCMKNESTGEEITAVKGDVVYLEKGDTITYWTPDSVHTFVIMEAAM